MKPIKVRVVWSESDHLRDGSEMAFPDFEIVARGIARHNRDHYDKTRVAVVMDTGDIYEMRLDLAEGDSHGVRHHVEGYLRHADTPDGRKLLDDSRAYRDWINSIGRIEWK